MPGLFDNSQNQVSAGADLGSPREAPEATDDEKSAAHSAFLDNGLKLIHDEKVMKQVMQMIGGGNPIEGIGNALVMVLTRLVEGAKQAGVEFPREVISRGALELFLEMAELSAEAGVHEFTEEQLETAFAMGFQIYTLQAKGKQDGEPPLQPPAGPAAGQPPPEPGGRTGLMPGGAQGGM